MHEPVNCYWWIEITLLTVKFTINTVCIWSVIVQVLHQYLPRPCVIMCKCCFLVQFLYLMNEWISHQFLFQKLLGLFLGLEVYCSDRCLIFFFRVLEKLGPFVLHFISHIIFPLMAYTLCAWKVISKHNIKEPAALEGWFLSSVCMVGLIWTVSHTVTETFTIMC